MTEQEQVSVLAALPGGLGVVDLSRLSPSDSWEEFIAWPPVVPVDERRFHLTDPAAGPDQPTGIAGG